MRYFGPPDSDENDDSTDDDVVVDVGWPDPE